MFQNLMFFALVFLRGFVDGLSSEAFDKLNGSFIRGRSRTRLLDASSSRSSVSE